MTLAALHSPPEVLDAFLAGDIAPDDGLARRFDEILEFIPRAVAWLGYDPIPEPQSSGARLRTCRVAGLSQVARDKLLPHAGGNHRGFRAGAGAELGSP